MRSASFFRCNKRLATLFLMICSTNCWADNDKSNENENPQKKLPIVSRIVNRSHGVNLELGPVEIEDWGKGPSELEVLLGKPVFESRALKTLERLTLIHEVNQKARWYITVGVRTPNSPLTIQNDDNQIIKQTGGKLLYRQPFAFSKEVSAFKTELQVSGMHTAGVYLHFKDRLVTITLTVPQEFYEDSRDDIQRFLNGILPFGSEDATEAIEDSELYFEDVASQTVLSYLPPWNLSKKESCVALATNGAHQIGKRTKLSGFSGIVFDPDVSTTKTIESYSKDILGAKEFEVVSEGITKLGSFDSRFFNVTNNGKIGRFQILANDDCCFQMVNVVDLQLASGKKIFKDKDPFQQFGRFSPVAR